MKKRRIFAAILAAIMAFSMVFASAITAFAYEDNYGKNGNILWRESLEYPEGIYTLNNKMNGTTSNLVMFLVTEDVYYIDQMDIDYRFSGKMNREDAPNFGFEIRVGMPANYTTSSTVELGGIASNVKQVQVGIYPGYYNFYNYGNNYASYANKDPFYAVTLSPNYYLIEDDAYKSFEDAPEDTFVEIQDGQDKRIYVLVGELEFLKLAAEDFENWAIETETKYMQEAMAGGEGVEIEVEVPEENLENLLESVQPSVEVEMEEEAPPTVVFEEITPQPEVEEDGGNIFVVVSIVCVVLAILCFSLGLACHKLKGDKY